MPTPERYELIETIAKGDFATVFRARDRELGREVAIKQIHQQYLDDPAQLERYWQEAQLLASLDHPYIMTIYDVVRSRGWLVLELMKGSLQQQLGGRPIDLEDLRLTLIYTLSALQFLHKNGIIHGDVKPGNLLLDRNNRIKLGDFGIARRIASGEGSVVKGTTKYMAPEVLSDQFGEVGPQSDIYSLGFSAYELMCGSQFESLFPGLNMYGRDMQVAWMMWHSAPDRRLPPIEKVLEGVPPDLAAVIERMTEKDPARRYKNADRPLAELRVRGAAGGPEDEEELAAQAAAAKKARRQRLLAIGAFAFSVLLCVAILFIPTGGNGDSDGKSTGGQASAAAPPKTGRVLLIEREFKQPYIRLDVPGSANPSEVTIDPNVDRFYVNGTPADFAALKKGDHINIERLTAEGGKKFQAIYATRPITQSLAGKVVSIDVGQGILRVAVADKLDPVEVYVPGDARVQLNEEVTVDGRRVDIGNLKIDDRVEIDYTRVEGRDSAVEVAATRTIKLQGYVQSLSSAERTLTVRLGEAADAPTQTLPVADNCAITINGAAEKDGRPIVLAQLQAADRITLERDARVRRIDALRGLEAKGTVASIDYEAGTFVLGDATFSLAPGCTIHAVDIDEPVTFSFLRPSDRVIVSHNSFDLASPVAQGITVEPVPDKRTWALLLADPKYAADAQRVQTSLGTWYRVPAEQMLLVEGTEATIPQQRIAEFLPKVAAGSQLIAYAVGDGRIEESAAYVASGIAFNWLMDQLEATAAADRLLVLDTCHADGEPSAYELAETRNRAGVPVSESVTVLAACKQGEKGETDKEGRDLLAHFFAEAFRGEADNAPRDGRIRGDELAAYLARNLASAGGTEEPAQTPFLFVPGKIPRLHPDVKEDVLAMLVSRKLDQSYYLAYARAQKLAPDQPDVESANALMVLAVGHDTRRAREQFAELRTRFPASTIVLPGSAWTKLVLEESTEPLAARRAEAYREGIAELAALVRSLPPADAGPASIPPYALSLVRYAGGARQFVLKAAEPALTLADVKPLDDFFIGRDDLYVQAYRRGIAQVEAKMMELDRKIAAAEEPAQQDLLRKARRRIVTYLDFDLSAAADLLRTQLDD